MRGQVINFTVPVSHSSNQHLTSKLVRDFLDHHDPKLVDESLVEKRSAVAMVLYFGDLGPEVLLMKRAYREGDKWSGQISMPGGREEDFDSSLLDTARRECFEELGIDLNKHAEHLGRLDDVQAMAKFKVLPLSISPFVFEVREKPAARLSDEATAWFWFPLMGALDGSFDGEFIYPGADSAWKLPCWNYEEFVIWGLTYKMLSNFLESLKSRLL